VASVWVPSALLFDANRHPCPWSENDCLDFQIFDGMKIA
jgi:hypothetical protein